MKKNYALLTAAMTFASVAAMANPFSDVPATHWAYDAVSSLANKGVLAGFPDGTFKGEKSLTRYQLSMVVAKMLSNTEQGAAFGGSMSAKDLQTLEKLTVEFADELALLGVKVSALEDDMAAVKADVAGIKSDVNNIKSSMNNGSFSKVAVSGDMLVSYTDILKGQKNTPASARIAGQHNDAMFRLRFDAKINENIEAAVRTVMYADEYGRKLGGATTDGEANTQGGKFKKNDVDVAYLQIKDVLNGTLKVGRDFMTNGSALILNDNVDAISYTKVCGKVGVNLNKIEINNKSEAWLGISTNNNKQPLWNLNLDYGVDGRSFYLGYYEEHDVDGGSTNPDERTYIEAGSKGNITKDHKFGYDLSYVKSENNYSQAKDEDGDIYHIALTYDTLKDWNFKLAYTESDDEYAGPISLDYNQRTFDGIETPFDDIKHLAVSGGSLRFSMKDIELAKFQAEYAPSNSRHGVRVAYDSFKRNKGTVLTNDIEFDVITLEYRYRLAENTRVRVGYHTLNDDTTARDLEDDQVYVEIYSRF